MKFAYPRIPIELIEIIPLIESGVHWLKSSWEFPAVESGERRKVKLRLTDALAQDIAYLSESARISRQAVIVAALVHAKAGKWRRTDVAEESTPHER